MLLQAFRNEIDKEVESLDLPNILNSFNQAVSSVNKVLGDVQTVQNNIGKGQSKVSIDSDISTFNEHIKQFEESKAQVGVNDGFQSTIASIEKLENMVDEKLKESEKKLCPIIDDPEQMKSDKDLPEFLSEESKKKWQEIKGYLNGTLGGVKTGAIALAAQSKEKKHPYDHYGLRALVKGLKSSIKEDFAKIRSSLEKEKKQLTEKKDEVINKLDKVDGALKNVREELLEKKANINQLSDRLETLKLQLQNAKREIVDFRGNLLSIFIKGLVYVFGGGKEKYEQLNKYFKKTKKLIENLSSSDSKISEIETNVKNIEKKSSSMGIGP